MITAIFEAHESSPKNSSLGKTICVALLVVVFLLWLIFPAEASQDTCHECENLETVVCDISIIPRHIHPYSVKAMVLLTQEMIDEQTFVARFTIVNTTYMPFALCLIKVYRKK